MLGQPYGIDHGSRFAHYQTVSAYRLDEEVNPIRLAVPRSRSISRGRAPH
jgi:hypothetical protein